MVAARRPTAAMAAARQRRSRATQTQHDRVLGDPGLSGPHAPGPPLGRDRGGGRRRRSGLRLDRRRADQRPRPRHPDGPRGHRAVVGGHVVPEPDRPGPRAGERSAGPAAPDPRPRPLEGEDRPADGCAGGDPHQRLPGGAGRGADPRMAARGNRTGDAVSLVVGGEVHRLAAGRRRGGAGPARRDRPGLRPPARIEERRGVRSDHRAQPPRHGERDRGAGELRSPASPDRYRGDVPDARHHGLRARQRASGVQARKQGPLPQHRHRAARPDPRPGRGQAPGRHPLGADLEADGCPGRRHLEPRPARRRREGVLLHQRDGPRLRPPRPAGGRPGPAERQPHRPGPLDRADHDAGPARRRRLAVLGPVVARPGGRGRRHLGDRRLRPVHLREPRDRHGDRQAQRSRRRAGRDRHARGDADHRGRSRRRSPPVSRKDP